MSDLPPRDPVDVLLTLMATALMVVILFVGFVVSAILWAGGSLKQDPEGAVFETESHTEVKP